MPPRAVSTTPVSVTRFTCPVKSTGRGLLGSGLGGVWVWLGAAALAGPANRVMAIRAARAPVLKNAFVDLMCENPP
jgi:hypothetical protein